jgi:hypothetical protein
MSLLLLAQVLAVGGTTPIAAPACAGAPLAARPR